MRFTTKTNKATTASSVKGSNQCSRLRSECSQPEIAVIGMSCRFAKADSLEELWDLINSCGSATDLSTLWGEPKESFWDNFIRNPEPFDHHFFKISSREANSMDAKQRLLLQVVYQAMESAGYSRQSQNQESHIGCYVGVNSMDSDATIESENGSTYSATGSSRVFISDKVCQCFGWSGPSITFDTACSSSVIAIHTACKALGMNECSMAVAGGVNVVTSPEPCRNLGSESFLGPTGVEANSYFHGEGAGVVVLKLLSRAITDGDDILGIIKGSAVNQGSDRTPIPASHSDSQAVLYQQVLSAGNVHPKEVTYVEDNGRGPPVSYRAEAVSGIAGLLKAMLMIQHRINPKIPPLAPERMNISKPYQPFTSSRITFILNNYGAASSNVVLLLQEYSPAETDTPVETSSLMDLHQPEVPLFLSARTPESLRAYCAALDSFISKARDTHTNGIVADVAYNLAKRQNRDLEYSCTFSTSTKEALSARLKAAASGSIDFKITPSQSQPIVLCFGDLTGRIIRLSENIFNDSSILQTHLIECDSICQNFGLPSLFPRIFDSSPVDDEVQLQCMIFSLQYSVAKSWIDSGLEVDTLIGHGFGLLTALCIAGCFSLGDGIRLVSERARLIQNHWNEDMGIMLSIEGDKYDVEDLLELTKKRHPCASPEVACYDGPRNIVVSGTALSIKAIEDVVRSEGLSPHLKTARLGASPSNLPNGTLPEFKEILDTIQFKSPLIHIETCSAGQSCDRVDSEMVLQHMRAPIYFSDAVKRVARRVKAGIWLEASSASPIISMARRVLEAADLSEQYAFITLDLGVLTGQGSLAQAACALWEAGSKAAFWPFHRSRNSRKYRWLCLPPYQFGVARHSINTNLLGNGPTINGSVENPYCRTGGQQPELLQLLLRLDGKDESLFSVNTENEVFSLGVWGYTILGQSLCPASIFCELVLQAVKIVAIATPSAKVPRIWNMVMESPLGPRPTGRLFVTLSGGTDEVWSFTIFTESTGAISALTCHASGMVGLLDADGVAIASQSLKQLVVNSKYEIMSSSNLVRLSGESLYSIFGRTVNYANYYRGIQKVFAKGNEIASHVSVPEGQPSQLVRGCCDPVAIDIFLQVASIHINCLSKCASDEIFLCTMIEGFSLTEQFTQTAATQRRWTVYSNFESACDKRVTSNVFVVDPDTKNVVVTITGILSVAVSLKYLTRTLSKLNSSPQFVDPTTGVASTWNQL